MSQHVATFDELKENHFYNYQKLVPIYDVLTTDETFEELYIEQEAERDVTHMLLQDDEAATVVQVSLDDDRKQIWIKINELQRTFEFTELQSMYNCLRFFMEGVKC